jgi:hypothetical protein
MEGKRQTERQRIEWGESDGEWVTTIEELDRLLDALVLQAADRPFVVELISPKGDTLSVGLGLKESVLSWVPAGGDPPYFTSEGNLQADGTVVFFYRGDWSEFPRWSAIPVEAAREAVSEFWHTGQRPTSVKWEEV